MLSPKSGDAKRINELAQILTEVEQSLEQLQSRHSQVKQDWSKRFANRRTPAGIKIDRIRATAAKNRTT